MGAAARVPVTGRPRRVCTPAGHQPTRRHPTVVGAQADNMMYKCRALSRFGRAGWQNEAIKGIHTTRSPGQGLGRGRWGERGRAGAGGPAVEDGGVSQSGADPMGDGSSDLLRFILRYNNKARNRHLPQEGEGGGASTAGGRAGHRRRRRRRR